MTSLLISTRLPRPQLTHSPTLLNTKAVDSFNVKLTIYLVGKFFNNSIKPHDPFIILVFLMNLQLKLDFYDYFC